MWFHPLTFPAPRAIPLFLVEASRYCGLDFSLSPPLLDCGHRLADVWGCFGRIPPVPAIVLVLVLNLFALLSASALQFPAPVDANTMQGNARKCKETLPLARAAGCVRLSWKTVRLSANCGGSRLQRTFLSHVPVSIPTSASISHVTAQEVCSSIVTLPIRSTSQIASVSLSPSDFSSVRGGAVVESQIPHRLRPSDLVGFAVSATTNSLGIRAPQAANERPLGDSTW